MFVVHDHLDLQFGPEHIWPVRLILDVEEIRLCEGRSQVVAKVFRGQGKPGKAEVGV